MTARHVKSGSSIHVKVDVEGKLRGLVGWWQRQRVAVFLTGSGFRHKLKAVPSGTVLNLTITA